MNASLPAPTPRSDRPEYTLDLTHRILLHLEELREVPESTNTSTVHDACTHGILLDIWLDVKLALEGLPDDLRALLEMARAEDMTERKAAEQLGICQRALQKRLEGVEKTLLLRLEPHAATAAAGPVKSRKISSPAR